MDSSHSTNNVRPIRPQKRLNVNINRQTEEALASYASEYGVTITEAIRRLVVVGAHVLAEASKGKPVRIGDERVEFHL